MMFIRVLIAATSLFFLLSNPLAFPKTVTIPGDADTIQAAIDLAASGDDIIVNATEVEWVKRVFGSDNTIYHDCNGIRVTDKNLVITGKPSTGKTSIICLPSNELNEKNTMLYIQNSEVTLKNFDLKCPFLSRYYFDKPVASPLFVESGSLSVSDSHLNCSIECKGNLSISSSIIQGYAWVDDNVYTHHNFLDPAIHFFPAEKSRLDITDSLVFSNTQEGYCNIVIENADNSEIILRKSTFIGGTYYAGYGSYLDGHINGSDGISIEKCQGLIVNIDGCSFEGGEGSQARAQRIPVLEGGGKGGNGFAVHDSTIHLYFDSAPSLFNGGKGGDGGVLFDTFINAGNGGDGISLINSVVTVSADIEQPYQAFGGKGGTGKTLDGYSAKDGVDGLPFYIDEKSQWISNNPVADWAIFR